MERKYYSDSKHLLKIQNKGSIKAFDGELFSMPPVNEEEYGGRSSPYLEPRGITNHQGVDFKTRDENGNVTTGLPVNSVNEGKVIWSGPHKSYGNTVIIKHLNGKSTLYAHLEDGCQAKTGDNVVAGQVIGFSGDTGTGKDGEKYNPHLHFEVINEEGTSWIEQYGRGGELHPDNETHIGIPSQRFREDPDLYLPEGNPNIEGYQLRYEDGGDKNAHTALNPEEMSRKLYEWVGGDCPICSSYTGQIFSGSNPPETPPLHPNCDCELVEITKKRAKRSICGDEEGDDEGGSGEDDEGDDGYEDDDNNIDEEDDRIILIADPLFKSGLGCGLDHIGEKYRRASRDMDIAINDLKSALKKFASG